MCRYEGIYIDNEDTGFVNDENIVALIKFGRREHLSEILNGQMRFSPAKTYIDMEKQFKTRGQGDIFEGKLSLHGGEYFFFEEGTNNLIAQGCVDDFLLGFQGATEMPIICFFIITKEECVYTGGKNTCIINIPQMTKSAIKKDFNTPEAALILENPRAFISDIQQKLGVVASSVSYYDRNSDINNTKI